MAQYIYKIQPVRPAMLVASWPEEDVVIEEHFLYLQKLTEQGVVQLAGRTLVTDSRSFGIVIFEAESDEAAEKIVQNDPAVQKRMMRAEWFPFRVALQSG